MDDNFFEEIYEECQDIINPHVHCQQHGRCCITQDSLIPSVIESLEYLVEFWVANRDNPNINLYVCNVWTNNICSWDLLEGGVINHDTQ